MKTGYLIISILFFLVSCNKSNKIKRDTNLKIVGFIENMPDGLQLMLMNNGEVIAKDTLNTGKFEFSDSLKVVPTELTLMSVNPKTGEYSISEFWATNSLTKINGNGKYLSGWKITNNTENQKTLNKFLDGTRHILVSIDSIEQLRVKNLRQNNNEQVKYYSHIKDSLIDLRDLKEFEIIKNNFNNDISVDKLYEIIKFNNVLNSKEVKKIYDKLDGNYKNSLIGEGILIRTENRDIPKKGDTIIDLKLTDEKGEKHRLSDYKGKYVLLNFWGDGCFPTMKAIPVLNKLQSQNSDSLTVIGISLDENVERWKETIKNRELKYTNLTDGKGSYSGSSVKYGADTGSPFYFFIDKNGVILENWFGYKEGIFKEKLSEYISSLK